MTSFVRAFRGALRAAFAEAVAYRSEFVVWFLATNMPIVMLFLWRRVAEEGAFGRFGPTEFTAYFLVTLIVRLLTGSWVVWAMNYEIKQGTLAQRLLRPIHPYVSYAADNLGMMPMRVVVLLPIVIATLVIVGPEGFTDDRLGMAAFIPAVILAWAINFTAMLCVGGLGLFLESSTGIFEVWLGAYFVLSGYVVPLELFPAAVRDVVYLSPFPYLLSFPVEIALGLRTGDAVWRGLLAQLAYVTGLLGLALFIFRRGVARFQAFGG
jgi:ABC-2 type transport system permease protein